MSQSTRDIERSAVANADLTTKQFYIVVITTVGKVDLAASATGLIVGVLQNAPYTGEQATYRFGGTTKVVAAGVMNPGDLVTTDGSGLAVATTTNKDIVIGRYIGTAASAANDIVEVQLGIHKASFT